MYELCIMKFLELFERGLDRLLLRRSQLVFASESVGPQDSGSKILKLSILNFRRAKIED